MPVVDRQKGNTMRIRMILSDAARQQTIVETGKDPGQDRVVDAAFEDLTTDERAAILRRLQSPEDEDRREHVDRRLGDWDSGRCTSFDLRTEAKRILAWETVDCKKHEAAVEKKIEEFQHAKDEDWVNQDFVVEHCRKSSDVVQRAYQYAQDAWEARHQAWQKKRDEEQIAHARVLVAEWIRKPMSHLDLYGIGVRHEHVLPQDLQGQIKAERNRRARERAEQQQTQAEQEQQELETWAREYGSERLRLGVEAGCDMRAVYRDERLAKERPGWVWKSELCGEVREGVRNPTLVALQALKGCSVKDTSLAWLADGDHREDCPHSAEYGNGEEFVAGPVLVAKFLGRVIVQLIPNT